MQAQGIVSGLVTILHECYNAAGTAYVSGQANSISAVLLDENGSQSALPVTITEKGATGLYEISFSPDAAGSWMLRVTNPAGTDESTYPYPVIVRSEYLPTVSGATINEVWLLHECFNAQGTAYVSGKADLMTTVLYDQDGGTSVIPITITEKGSTGLYDVKFTPDEHGTWLLKVTNPAGTDEATYPYTLTIGDGDETIAAGDSFTTVARVEGLVRRGAYTPLTSPRLSDVIDRMVQQGSRIQARLVMVDNTNTPPNGGNPIDTSTENGKTLARLCDECNAFLAAAYVLQMHDVRNVDKDLMNAYLEAGTSLLGDFDDLAEKPGQIAAFLESGGSVQSSGGDARVNTRIETPSADLLRVSTMEN